MHDHDMTQPTEIKAIVFDADGVVIQTPYLFSEYLAQKHGLSREATAPFFTGIFQACLVGKADLKIEIAPYLRAWHWPRTVDAFLQTWFEVENAPDVALLESIARLRRQGIACYLGTNQEKYRVDYMRTIMHFNTHFDDVFASAHIGALKPHPAFYEHVTTQLALMPQHILFFDDMPRNVEAAHTHGWHAEHYTGKDRFDAALAAYDLKI